VIARLRAHPVAAFFLLACGLSWSYWLPMAIAGRTVSPGSNVTHFPGLFGPAIAAFLMVALTEGRQGIARLSGRLTQVSRPAWRFWFYSLSPIGFLLLAWLLGWISGSALPPWSAFGLYSGLPPLGLIPVFALVLLSNGFGEETGWRGFALTRLQSRFGPLRGAILLGILWAVWHVPAFWVVETYRQMSAATIVGGFGLGIISGSIVLARVAERTHGSVLAAALWHATYNMTSATAAGRGVIAAVTSTCVMVWAVVLVLHEWRQGASHSALADVADPTRVLAAR
jgi:membrane protease YdiL (CAAX protease family)